MRRFAFVTLSIVLSAATSTGCSLDTSGSAPEIEGIDDSGEPFSDSSIFPGDDSSTTDGDIPDEGFDTTITDTGTPVDTGMPPVDTGMPPVDTGMPPVDTGMPPVDTGMPPVDTGPTCDTTGCADPMGAKRVALIDRSKMCPPGFSQTDVVEDKGGDACTCGCGITNPVCPGAGEIQTKYGDSAACAGTGALKIYPTGTDVCTGLGLSGGGNLAAFFGADAPPPVGGACSATGGSNKPGIVNQLRLCEATGGTCEKPICGAAFTECIEVAGSCPTAYPNARTVGADISLVCPTCSCTLDRGTCTGNIQFFGSPTCGSKVGDFNADGGCSASGHSGENVKSFKYHPDAVKGQSCDPSYTSSPGTRSVIAPRNLCCR
jgi:hypothetical protein